MSATKTVKQFESGVTITPLFPWRLFPWWSDTASVTFNIECLLWRASVECIYGMLWCAVVTGDPLMARVGWGRGWEGCKYHPDLIRWKPEYRCIYQGHFMGQIDLTAGFFSTYIYVLVYIHIPTSRYTWGWYRRPPPPRAVIRETIAVTASRCSRPPLPQSTIIVYCVLALGVLQVYTSLYLWIISLYQSHRTVSMVIGGGDVDGCCE